jgi:hypothetical protein
LTFLIFKHFFILERMYAVSRDLHPMLHEFAIKRVVGGEPLKRLVVVVGVREVVLEAR